MMPAGAEDEYGEEGDGSTAAKTERKRRREKQRRSDLASAFDELSFLLKQVDPSPEDDLRGSGRRKRRASVSSAGEGEHEISGFTRLDVIGRTLETIRKLARQNEELRAQLSGQPQSLDGAGEEKEVLVMVPTLQPATNTGPPPQLPSPPQPSMYQQHYALYHPPEYGGPPNLPPYFPPPPPQGSQYYGAHWQGMYPYPPPPGSHSNMDPSQYRRMTRPEENSSAGHQRSEEL